MDELIENAPSHSIIGENLIRAWSKITRPAYDKIICTVSGGADSDVMLDIIWKCDLDNRVTYAWFDTGLEYQATKDHLEYLEKKYGIKIEKYNRFIFYLLGHFRVILEEQVLGMRSMKKRSLLSVNEHFEYEHNAEIAL